MPVKINGQTYYQTTEACSMAGISRSTFFRWLRMGVIEDVSHIDRKGWRLFTEEDISRMKDEAGKVTNRYGGAAMPARGG